MAPGTLTLSSSSSSSSSLGMGVEDTHTTFPLHLHSSRMEITDTDTLLMSLHTTAAVESARSWSAPEMQSVDCTIASAAGVADMVMVITAMAMRMHHGKFKSNEACMMGNTSFQVRSVPSPVTVLVA